MNRPEFVTDEHLDYLDELRESGETNMVFAAPYLREEFPELDENTSSDVLGYWMESFGKADR